MDTPYAKAAMQKLTTWARDAQKLDTAHYAQALEAFLVQSAMPYTQVREKAFLVQLGSGAYGPQKQVCPRPWVSGSTLADTLAVLGACIGYPAQAPRVECMLRVSQDVPEKMEKKLGYGKAHVVVPQSSSALAAGHLEAMHTGYVYVDTLQYVLQGPGGHAAMPHATRDVVLGTAHKVALLQSLVSRYKMPQEQLLLRLGNWDAPGATNVLAAQSVFGATLYTTDAEVRQKAHSNLRSILGKGKGAVLKLRPLVQASYNTAPGLLACVASSKHITYKPYSLSGMPCWLAPTKGSVLHYCLGGGWQEQAQVLAGVLLQDF